MALVKVNIAISLQGFAVEWYTFELSDFDRNTLNNNPGVKNWVNTLSHGFKISSSITLGLFTYKTYSLDDAQAWRPLIQYVRAIIQYNIRYNIIDVANQLSFAYRGLAPELQVFISPPTKSTKAADFIYALEEKYEIWHKMITTLAGPQLYYKPAQRP